MEQQKEKELSFHRQDIEKKHRNVIIHYLQYENDILEKRISPRKVMAYVASECNLSVDGVRYILSTEGVYLNKDNFCKTSHLPWVERFKEINKKL